MLGDEDERMMPKTRPSRGLSYQLQNQVVENVGNQEMVAIWNEVTFRRKIDTSRVTIITTTVQLEQKGSILKMMMMRDGESAAKKKKMVVQNDKDSETETEEE
jgi:hypothetical protein